MRCLHCSKRILLRKFSNGEFCSEAHRQAFFEEQQRLALARLAESERALSAAAKRRDAASSPTFLSVQPAPFKSVYIAVTPANPYTPAPGLTLPATANRAVFDPTPETVVAPAPLIAIPAATEAHSGRVRLRAFGPGRAVARITTPCMRPVPAAHGLRTAGTRREEWDGRLAAQGIFSAPLAVAGAVTRRRSRFRLRLPAVELTPAGPKLPLEQGVPPCCGVVQAARPGRNCEIIPLVCPTAKRRVIPMPLRPRFLAMVESKPAPGFAGLLAAATGTEGCRGFARPMAISHNAIPLAPGCRRVERVTSQPAASLGQGSLVSLAMPEARSASVPLRTIECALATGGLNQPARTSVAPPATAGARLAFAAVQPYLYDGASAAGERPIYANGDFGQSCPAPDCIITTAGAEKVIRTAACSPLRSPAMLSLPPALPAPGSLTARNVESGTYPAQVEFRTSAPGLRPAAPGSSGRLMRLLFAGQADAGPRTLMGANERIASAWTPMLMTGIRRLVPFDDTIRSAAAGVERGATRRLLQRWPVSLPALVPARLRSPKVWAIAAAILVMAILLGKFPSGGAAANNGLPTQEAKSGFSRQWEQVQDQIVKRAAVNLQDDFRAGLSDWRGKDNWAREWKYDTAGFIHTGSLALYTPSMALNNYSLEFLGQIERKALGWVVRAKDYDNYYAMKLVLDRPGPLPQISLVRYAVIDGKATGHQRVLIPTPVRNDSLFRIRVNVQGENITTSIQGQVVDFWADRRLSWGGIGFFSGKGEQSRIRWVEVSHHYDILGRLCALVAPSGMVPAEGGLNR
ncbi:MAG: hypothetical protein IT160_02710 [Bryobacterales bacterium]|nr:hypothetical protein [Bryobacterales bacterium]